ncbi:MAG: hypothetical protein ACE5HD_08185 [Acidobacteriota bacterium]
MGRLDTVLGWIERCWEWGKRFWAAVMTGGFVGTVVVWFADLQWPFKILSGLIAVAVVLWIGIGIAHIRKRKRIKSLEFYQDRSEMNSSRLGALGDQLGSVNVEALGVFPAGQFLGQLSENQLRKLRHLILPNPDTTATDKELEEHFKHTFSGIDVSVAHFRETIRKNSKKAKSVGVRVYFHPDMAALSSISLLIVDPEEDDGWARIEIVLPFTEPASRPSVVIAKKSYGKAFRNLEALFNKLKEQSKEFTP